MENTSDSFMPGSLLFCMKSKKSVCYSVADNTYLRKHKVTVHGRYGNKEAEAEGYIECMQVTPAGAVFYQSGNLLKLKDEEIEREVREDQ